MKPLVSIITPTYNHEKYIGQCIESVLGQSYKNWEMIIIDDGSADGTPDVIKRYGDKRIVCIRKEHKGIDSLGENYNHALALSKGDFILILEGDDFIPADRLELQLPAFENEKIVLSHGRYATFREGNVSAVPVLFRYDVLRNNPQGTALNVFLNGFNFIGTQSVMVRKTALVKAGGFLQPQYLPLVDYPTWMRLALQGQFAYMPQVLGFWRRHSESITMNRSDEIFQGFIRYCDAFTDLHRQELATLNLQQFARNRGGIAFLSLAISKLSSGEWDSASDLLHKSWQCRASIGWPFLARTMIAMLGALLHINLPGKLMNIRQFLIEKGYGQ